jgi:hypothetical protein
MFIERKRLGIELRHKVRILINNEEIQMAGHHRILEHIKDVKARAAKKLNIKKYLTHTTDQKRTRH